MSGRIVEHGMDDPPPPHECNPVGDRTNPAPEVAGMKSPPGWVLRHADPGDVYECDCGTRWICRKTTCEGPFSTYERSAWRKEGRLERRWRLRKERTR